MAKCTFVVHPDHPDLDQHVSGCLYGERLGGTNQLCSLTSVLLMRLALDLRETAMIGFSAGTLGVDVTADTLDFAGVDCSVTRSVEDSSGEQGVVDGNPAGADAENDHEV